jgi:hypothetical protein
LVSEIPRERGRAVGGKGPYSSGQLGTGNKTEECGTQTKGLIGELTQQRKSGNEVEQAMNKQEQEIENQLKNVKAEIAALKGKTQGQAGRLGPVALLLRICARLATWFFLVRFEIFTAVTMKNGVFWDVTPCGSCKNRRFGGS